MTTARELARQLVGALAPGRLGRRLTEMSNLDDVIVVLKANIADEMQAWTEYPDQAYAIERLSHLHAYPRVREHLATLARSLRAAAADEARHKQAFEDALHALEGDLEMVLHVPGMRR